MGTAGAEQLRQRLAQGLAARPVLREALRALGGGRMKLDDKIDHSVSVHLIKKIGDAVSVGDTVIELLYNDDTKLAEAMKYLTDCWNVSEKAERRELILDYVF